MTGHRPHGSADQARQAPEHLCEESLIRRARRQMQTNLLFEFHHPNDEADRQQTQRIELQAPPRRPPWHRGTQGPHDPVGTGVQKQSHLIGACRVAGMRNCFSRVWLGSWRLMFVFRFLFYRGSWSLHRVNFLQEA